MPTYRVTMIIADDPSRPLDNREITTRFAGCSSEDDARRKARETYAPRIVGVKTVKKVED